ncbi:MAG TPA: hypothetical protein VGE29_19245 [Prosthecobacter sp.]
MSPFIQRLIRELSTHPPQIDLNNVFLAAREALLKFGGTDEYDPYPQAEWRKELDQTDLSAQEIKLLIRHLKLFVRQHPAHTMVGTAIWALTATNSKAEAHFFRDQISVHAKSRNSHAVDQADYGLLRLGLDHIRWNSNQWIEPWTNLLPESYWIAVSNYLRRSRRQRIRFAPGRH